MNTNARYETPIANPFAPQADTELEVQHEPLFETASVQTSIFDWVKEKSPAIAIIAGNLLLLAGEYRVYHFAYESTARPGRDGLLSWQRSSRFCCGKSWSSTAKQMESCAPWPGPVSSSRLAWVC
jgi:hypothetical protein